MATYNDPDDFLDKSQIGWGVGDGRESLRSSLKATNGAAHRGEGEAKAAKVAAVSADAKLDKLGADVAAVLQRPDLVEFGIGVGKESVVASLTATNRAAHNAQDASRSADARLGKMEAAVAAQGVLLAQIAEKLGLTKPVDPPPPVPPPALTYTVVAGDTLGKIAAKFGVTIADLVAWNSLADPNTIAVGQVLKVSAPKA